MIVEHNSRKNITRVDTNTTSHRLDCNQVTYYNTGNTIVTVDGVPIFPNGGTLSEIDYSIFVKYTDNPIIKFDSSNLAEGTEAKNELFIIEKTYYSK